MGEWLFGLRQPFALGLLIPLGFLFWYSSLRENRGSAFMSSCRIILDRERSSMLPLKTAAAAASLFFWLSLSVLAVSAAGPELRKKNVVYLDRGSEYFFVLDVSPSMAVKDAGGMTRLEAGKKIIRTISASGGNNYPGLVLFGRNAVVAVPPTSDLAGFNETLDMAAPMALGDGTSIGTAVALAAYHLRDSSAENKIIFLLSDGGHNHGELPPLDAAAMLRDSGIRIICYALGRKDTGAAEVVIDTGLEGKVSGIVTDSYKPALLHDMADISGGYCFEGSAMTEVQRGIAAVRSIDGGEIRTETGYSTRDLGYLFILLGVPALIISMVFKVFVVRELVP